MMIFFDLSRIQLNGSMLRQRSWKRRKYFVAARQWIGGRPLLQQISTRTSCNNYHHVGKFLSWLAKLVQWTGLFKINANSKTHRLRRSLWDSKPSPQNFLSFESTWDFWNPLFLAWKAFSYLLYSMIFSICRKKWGKKDNKTNSPNLLKYFIEHMCRRHEGIETFDSLKIVLTF